MFNLKGIKTNFLGRRKAKVTEYERETLERELLEKLFDFDNVYLISIDPREKTNKDKPGKERPDLIEKLKKRYETLASNYPLELYDKTNKIYIYQASKDPKEDTVYICDITLEGYNAKVEAYLDRNGRKDTIVRNLTIENPSAIVLYRKGISWITDNYLAFKGAIKEGKDYHNEIAAIILLGKDKIGVIKNSGYTIR
ncbi:MAG: hypothetical protein J7K83_01725 [Candidatus Aenigmarchaeota archaeon]|nr:hypothetical protein [Candidatus Aenigmarchaeota archaeon]